MARKVNTGGEAIRNLPQGNLEKHPFVNGVEHKLRIGRDGVARIRTEKNVKGVQVIESPAPLAVTVNYTRNGYCEIIFTPQLEMVEYAEISATTVFNMQPEQARYSIRGWNSTDLVATVDGVAYALEQVNGTINLTEVDSADKIKEIEISGTFDPDCWVEIHRIRQFDKLDISVWVY